MTIPLRRPGSGTLQDPLASEVENDSTVPGDTVEEALDNIAGGVVVGTDNVANDSLVSGATATAALNALKTAIDAATAAIAALTSSDVANASAVTGATVTAALNALNTAIGAVTSSQVSNLSGVAGATVTAALDTLNAAIAALTTTSIANASTVSGATATAALNALNSGKIGRVKKTLITATGAGTYTPTAGMLYVTVKGTAGGASGGGADCNNGVSEVAIGGGGSAGGTFEKTFSAADIGASKAYSVGAGGSAGTSGSNGNNGGNTTFDTCTANGGVAGIGSGVNTTVPAMAIAGIVGGTATGGDENIQGGSGQAGMAASSATCLFCVSGGGGASVWGTGGIPRAQAQASLTDDLTQAGSNGPATHYGSGGGGAMAFSIGAGSAGGTGADGAIEFTEYLSA